MQISAAIFPPTENQIYFLGISSKVSGFFHSPSTRKYADYAKYF